MKLQGRRILVTGGFAGTRLELAKQLLALANTVIITGRNQTMPDAAVTANPGPPRVQCNAADPAALKELGDTAEVG